MKCVLLAGLAVAGILVSVQIHLADGQYRAGREILESKGDLREAAERFESALETGADDPLYALRRGSVSLAIGTPEELEEAVVWFRRAARLGPVMARSQYWWGAALERLGRADEALARYEVARRLAPYNVDLNRRIADSYLRRWGRTRSREDLKRAFMTIHALRLVEPEATHQALARLLTRPLLRYDDLDAVVPRTAEERLTLAETLVVARRFRWVVRAFDEADRLAEAGGRLSIRGRMLKFRDDVKGHPESALALLLEVREIAGEAFAEDLALGRILLRLGRHDEAREALARALSAAEELVPTIETIHRVFVEVGGEAGPEAELALWTAVSKQYTSHEALGMNFHAATAAHGLGRPSEAVLWLRPYLKMRRFDPRGYHLMARCYKDLGQNAIARENLRLALNLRPNDPELRAFALELGMEDER